MNKLAVVALVLISTAAFAQAPTRIRGTITALEGNVLSVKSRDGRDLKLHLAPDATVAAAKATTLSELKPGSYVGSAARKRPDGTLVAMEVHTLPPQVPAGQMAWDLEPGSTMTNADLAGVVQVAGGTEITLQHKGGSQKILVPPGTPIRTFTPADRSALKPGEAIFSVAQRQADGRLVTQRVQVSRDGVKPAH